MQIDKNEKMNELCSSGRIMNGGCIKFKNNDANK